MPTVLEQSGYEADRKLKVIGTNPVKHDGIDKVTGRAKFGADRIVPGMLVGKILRSPHPHAIIRSIDASAALALAGVKAVVTRDDFPEYAAGTPPGDLSRNVMAREKVLYDGHAVAAVAATSEAIARKALKLIRVDYEVLPHVIDQTEAMQADAPILHDHLRSKGVADAGQKRTNVAERHAYNIGDVTAGFAKAEVVVEHEFRTPIVHQGYMEPQACVASCSEDGQVELWCCTQGHFVVRALVAALLKIDSAKVRVTASELGGGFGGKTGVYAEPVAVLLSRKANRPVKIVLTRAEVFRGTGPAAATGSRVKLGATRDGKFTAAEAEQVFQTGAFGATLPNEGPKTVFSRYVVENAKAVCYEVISNRPKVTPYRAPGVPPSILTMECVVDQMAKKLGMDPIDLRLKNAAREGDITIFGTKFGPIGMVECLEAAKRCEHYTAPLGPNQGRGVAAGCWFNIGGETTASLNIAPDGSVTIMLGTMDVAGSRISIAMMAAEELGVPLDKVRANFSDTGGLGFNMPAVGSRVTFSTGMVVIESARRAIKEMCRRAAKIWNVPEEEVIFEDGYCRPASSNVGDFQPLSVADIARRAGATGGAIAGHAEMNVTGAAPGFGVHIVDVEVDKELGLAKVVRYTVVQDAGKAIHPQQVEGQCQGGAVQGIGWALNEEYVYGADGRLQNSSFLDYRIPVASDVPMIEPVIIEVPNPLHPYGLRGVGEVPVTPALAAIANAVADAIGVYPRELPMSPPRLLKLIDEAARA